jgi:hypothetical protein
MQIVFIITVTLKIEISPHEKKIVIFAQVLEDRTLSGTPNAHPTASLLKKNVFLQYIYPCTVYI